MKLRPYQAKLKTDIYTEWDRGVDNVLAVSPTGSGKTVLFSEIIKEHTGASCAIAHRQELVSQISLALARDGVRHKIIGPKKVVRLCVNLHMLELGQNYYDSSSSVAVAGVDTLVRRYDELKRWLNSVTLWIQDEAHHVLEKNKWGVAASMFPNAKGLGVTATPTRADGKGLGSHADGLMDVMIEGPTMRELIDQGYLTDYRIYAPPSDLDLSNVTTSKDGDYNKVKLKKAVRKSHVIGDVVDHYIRIAKGKLGITFATDVETATDIAAQFNAQGIPAAVVSAKTPDADRIAILRKFKNRELLQLVNVDLFGEGFDLPAIEVVSMARPTQSYALFVQQFGRALRLLDGKLIAIIIDHVGNVLRHGLPDAPRTWSLDARDKRGKGTPDDVIPVRACLNPKCLAIYERIHNKCPFCGYKPVPAPRSGPDQVDGDLTEITPEILAIMRGEVDKIDRDKEEVRTELQNKHAPTIGVLAGVKRHVESQEMQEALRASIAWWAGYHRDQDQDDSEIYRRFFHLFGIDIMTAQSLKTKEALQLANKINNKLGALHNGINRIKRVG